MDARGLDQHHVARPREFLHRLRRPLHFGDFNHAFQSPVTRGGGDLAAPPANGKQMVQPRRGRPPSDFQVCGAGAISLFGHVPQHGHPPSRAGQLAQGLQRRQHRVRVGVVAVVQYHDPAGVGHLQAHPARRARQQAPLDFLPAQSHLRSHRQGQQRVDHLMPAQKPHPIFPSPCRMAAFHAKGRPVFVRSHFPRHPIIAPIQARQHDSRARAPRDDLAPGIVAVEKKHAVGGQTFGRGPFLARHPDQVMEKFQMLAGDVGHHAQAGRHHLEQRRQFARMIGARFQHGRLVRALQAQQSQRHADIIVKTGFAPKGRLLLPQDRRNQLLGRGLAVGTGHRDHQRLKFTPIRRSQTTQRAPRLVHQDKRTAVQTRRRLAPFGHHGRHSAPPCFGQKGVAVKLPARQGEKQIARLRLARIGANARDGAFGRAVEQLAFHRLRKIFQRTRFHDLQSCPPPPATVKVCGGGGSGSRSGLMFK